MREWQEKWQYPKSRWSHTLLLRMKSDASGSMTSWITISLRPSADTDGGVRGQARDIRVAVQDGTILSTHYLLSCVFIGSKCNNYRTGNSACHKEEKRKRRGGKKSWSVKLTNLNPQSRMPEHSNWENRGIGNVRLRRDPTRIRTSFWFQGPTG